MIYDELKNGAKQMSTPVKLLLACVLCLAVIVGVAMLIQAFT